VTPGSSILRAALVGAAAAFCGCSAPAPVCSYLSSQAELHRINRAVLLELGDDSSHPFVAKEITDDLLRGLQERRLFRVELLRSTEVRFGTVPVRPDARYTLQEMKQLREGLDCDAVIVGSLSSFQQFPRMQMGLRLTLLDLRNGKVIWSVDNLWDTRDRDVEDRIRAFFEDRMAHRYEPVNWQIANVSTSAFEKFVAYEVAQTLPSRPAP
jgi:hypothetical protein